MAYIGRDTDKISNIEKLDTITFDGSSSYTLQKNSVNFTPNSANSLQVSIDGVVQAGNFTVSGSTIDFGVAIPSTSTCDFIFHYGTGLITTPADGTVGLAQLSATGTKDATTFLRGDNTFAEPTVGLTKLASTTVTTAVANVEFDSTYVGDYSTYLLIISAFSAATDGYDIGVQFLQDSTSVTALHIHNWKNMNNSASNGMDTRSDYHEVIRDGEASSTRSAGLVWIVLNNNKTTEGGGAYGFGSTLNQNGDYYGYESNTIFTSDITLNKIRVLDIAGSNVDSGTFTLYGVTK